MNKNTHKNLNRPMLERILFIHRKIAAGYFPSTSDLAREIEAGTATISRDIEYMRDRLLAPIEYDAAQRGYFYAKEYELPLNSLSAENVSALAVAKQLISYCKGTPVYDEICTLIDFLCGEISETQEENSGKPRKSKPTFIDRIAVPPAPESFTDKKIWNLVVHAMKQNRKIEFDYQGHWNKSESHRKIRPYQILVDEGICYCFGFCELRNAERLFVLNKMKNPKIIEETFSLPDDFDFASRCKGGKFGAFAAENPQKYVIEFFDEACEYVSSIKWADDQKIEKDDSAGKITISFTSSQSFKIAEWVLSQGSCARPLEPPELVENWKQNIEGMKKLAQEKLFD